MKTTKTAVIVPCKGRLAHLKQTIYPLVDSVAACENTFLVVVDYGCPDGCGAWVLDKSSLKDVLVVRDLPFTDEYNRSRARNCGAMTAVQAGAERLLFVDCDAAVGLSFVRDMVEPLEEDGRLYTAVVPQWNCVTDPTERGVGVIACWAGDFLHVRGYDEAMTGWGYEDEDFCNRLGTVVQRVRAPISMLKHSHRERVAHHEVKSIVESKARNMDLARRPGRIVNPNGFGE